MAATRAEPRSSARWRAAYPPPRRRSPCSRRPRRSDARRCSPPPAASADRGRGRRIDLLGQGLRAADHALPRLLRLLHLPDAIPASPARITLTPEQVLALVRAGERLGAKEALFSLGDKPEALFPEHREFLRRMGHRTTLGYLRAVSALRRSSETGAPAPRQSGPDGRARPAVAARGQRQHGHHARDDLRAAARPGPRPRPRARQGAARAGSGPSRSPASCRHPLHHRHPASASARPTPSASRRSSPSAICTSATGHIQEVIVQNFRAQAATIPMRGRPEPAMDDLLRTVAVARLLLGPDDEHPGAAQPVRRGLRRGCPRPGINDWGGVSPLTPDHINPERPWPGLARAAARPPRRAGHELARAAGRLSRVRDARRVRRRAAARRACAALVDADGLVRRPRRWRTWN